MPRKSKEPSQLTATETTPIIAETPLRAGMKLIERDSFGLLIGTEYIFDDNGNVNWRKMVPAQYLYLNAGDPKAKERIEKKYKKSVKDIDIIADNVEDRDLVITLAGLKYLLRLRGFTSVSSAIKEANERFATVSCYIDFIPNFETENRDQSYSENGSAHLYSTDGFMRSYLVEAASNRAFARCIRNYLNINIVSREELFDQSKVGNIDAATTSQPTSGEAYSILENKAIEKGWGFEKVKKASVNYKAELNSDPLTWNTWSDIPANDCYVLLGKINGASK